MSRVIQSLPDFLCYDDSSGKEGREKHDGRHRRTDSLLQRIYGSVVSCRHRRLTGRECLWLGNGHGCYCFAEVPVPIEGWMDGQTGLEHHMRRLIVRIVRSSEIPRVWRVCG